jgi:acetyltransferase-like isoleucine patch superfamily enzyme
MSVRAALAFRFRRTPAPRALVAAYLSARWRCRVSSRAKILFPQNCRFGRGTWIGECTIIASGRGVNLGPGCDIHDGSILDTQSGEISLGERSGIGPYTVVYGLGGVNIGAHCAIAGHSMIVASSHRFDRSDVPIREQGLTGAGIRIADNVWIGANCVVLDGATIAEGCVVAASSLVRGALPPYTTVAGTPARVVRERSPGVRE